jgi:hypothetical protein
VKGNECTNLSYRWELVRCNRFPVVTDTTRDLLDGISGNGNKLGKGGSVDLVVRLGFHPFCSTRAMWDGCVRVYMAMCFIRVFICNGFYSIASCISP